MLALIALLGGLGIAQAEEPSQDLQFDLEGYYRIRGHMFKDLFTVPLSGPQSGRPNQTGKYLTQRLRLQPVVNYEKLAKFTMQADLLDDVVWGDNAMLSTTSLFAGQPSKTDLEGKETADIKVKRAWMEFFIPALKINAGRQPSHWGMGLLANNGDGFDDMFGENHGGSTYDRLIVATRPLAIYQKITGKPDSQTPLFLAIGVDRLVEDPLDQSADHIRIRASPILPLRVNLEHDHILSSDQTANSPKRNVLFGLVELYLVLGQHRHEGIHALVVTGLPAGDGAILNAIDG